MFLRSTLVGLLIAATIVVVLAGCNADEASKHPESLKRTSAGEPEREEQGVAQQETEDTAATTAEPLQEEQRCARHGEEEIRIGDFSPPGEADVPLYEIIDEEPVERT